MLKSAPSTCSKPRVRAFADICRILAPEELAEFLLGVITGKRLKVAEIRLTVLKAVARLLEYGKHVEAASVLVAMRMKDEAREAINHGLEAHSYQDPEQCPADYEVCERLEELWGELEYLPGK